MIFSTAQAAKALCVAPATMRNHRKKKGIGSEIMPGRTGWNFDELESLRRDQGRRLPQWLIRFTVSQLRGARITGSMVIWAPTESLAKAKASTWFWNAELKANPKRYGVPVLFTVETIKEQVK